MGTFYTPDEVDAILEEALKTQPLPGDMTRDQLQAVTTEMGITPEALTQAEAEWRSARELDSPLPEAVDQERARFLPLIVAIPMGLFLLIAAGHMPGFAVAPIILLLGMFFVGVSVRLATLRRRPDRNTAIAHEKRMRLRERLGLPLPERRRRRGW